MNAFSDEDLEKLTQLCRIQCSSEEKKKFAGGLKKILAYVDQLKEIHTEGVPSCNHVIETIANVMREDAPGATLPRDVFLANSPAHVGGMIRVPPVIQFD